MPPSIYMPEIRPAEVQNAHQIHDLLTEAFGERYLCYTIFQTSQSMIYVQNLIEQGFEQSGHIFFIIERAGVLKGFYNAVVRWPDFFLNYIAVSKPERSAGYGRLLLSHFEAQGALLGCRQYGLDVFESNQLAYQWYLKHGYHIDSASYQVRLLTANGALASEWPLSVTDENLRNAMCEEQEKGFSKVDGLCGSGHITLGLIGGRVCRLLAYQGIELADAVGAVCARFQADRRVLIVPALPTLPITWSILDFEKTLRLVKPLL